MINWDFVGQSALRLILSALFASFVGYEREMHGRPAGLRTHILVAVGSTIFTLSSTAMAGDKGDHARIAAQVVTGVGFLGAGTILQQGSAVRGLTTAASLWAVAGVGLAVGVGGDMLIVATIACVVIVGTLTVMRHVERWLDRRRVSWELKVTVTDPTGMLHQINDVLEQAGIYVRNSQLTSGAGEGARQFNLRVHELGTADLSQITHNLSALPQVLNVEWS